MRAKGNFFNRVVICNNCGCVCVSNPANVDMWKEGERWKNLIFGAEYLLSLQQTGIMMAYREGEPWSRRAGPASSQRVVGRDETRG